MYFLFILFAIIAISVMIGKSYANIEGFKTATETQVAEGSSGMYKWGYTPIDDYVPVPPAPSPAPCPSPDHHRPCPGCGAVYNVNYNIEYSNKCASGGGGCSECDITRHPDIDKYVLKSSVPPCPDMNKYVLKSEMCPCTDMSQYIRKSEIPPCREWADKDKYILKTDCASYSYDPNNDRKRFKNRESESESEGYWYEQQATRGGGGGGGVPKAYNAIGEIV